MGSIFPRGSKLYFKVKGPDGWKQVVTPYKVGEERQAEAALAKVEARLAAGESTVGHLGPVTVGDFYKSWIQDRERDVRTWRNDESVFRLHVLPALGATRIDAVRAADISTLVKSWRKAMAPKSVHNAYSSLSAFFRDACLADLLSNSPCILKKQHLGPKEPKDPEFRATAVFRRDEVELLISDERIALDRRVLYALQALAGLRHGEAAALKWRNYLTAAQPLAQLYVAFSNENF